MKTALICGSFDPVTRGHEDLIRRAATLFDRVAVVIFDNSEKKYLFSSDERLAFLSDVCRAAGGNVTASRSDGTVAGYARENGVSVIVKGVRNAQDLVYEQDMARLNRLAGAPETLFLPADPALSHVSSSAAREFLRRGLPAADLLPDCVSDQIRAAYAAKIKE